MRALMLPVIDQVALLDDSLKFLPELLLCAGIVLLLALRLIPALDRAHLGWTALVFTLLALLVSACQWLNGYGGLELSGRVGEALGRVYQDLGLNSLRHPDNHGVKLFSNLLVYDTFTSFLRCFLFGFTALIIWLSLLTGIPDREDSADFYCLLLGATLGMAVMAEANHLLMVYIGVEMASLPSYALAGFLKGRSQSSEA